MEEITKSVIDKVSSYNIFNNFFPGIIFCYIVEKTTRFSLATGEIWENLFLYYFIGMIISRFGSIFVEKLLKAMKVKNKKTNERESFLKFAPYSDYIEASENSSFIPILNEANNTYRTIIAILIVVMGVKVYDWLLYDWVISIGDIGNNIVFLVVCLLVIILFVYSYKKQTDYVRGRVEKYINSKQKK